MMDRSAKFSASPLRHITFSALLVVVAPMFHSFALGSDDSNELLFWETGTTNFIMGKLQGPTILSNGEAIEHDIDMLQNVAYLWNYAGADIQYSVTQGCVDGDGYPCVPNAHGKPTHNGRNEIHFNSNELSGINDSVGKRTGHKESFSPCLLLPSGLCMDGKWTEADVFLNPSWVFFSWTDANACNSSSPDPIARNDYAEAILVHEVGHALGLLDFHSGKSNIMYETGDCSQVPRPGAELGLTERDKKHLRDIYGPYDQVAVDISHPQGNDAPIFPGNSLFLNALTARLMGADESGSSPESSFSIRWSSSDNVLGMGGSLTIDTEEIQPGNQEIVAEAVNSNGERLGSDSVTVQMVTQIATTDESLFHPLPCVELIGTTKCLTIIRESWTAGQCQAGIYDHEIQLTDLDTSMAFPVTEAGMFHSPFGSGCNDYQTYDLYHYAWPISSANSALMRFSHTVFKNFHPHASHTITGIVHRVEPFLGELVMPLACQLQPSASECEIQVSWDGLYFAPGSAVYVAESSSGSWERHVGLGVATGSVSIPVSDSTSKDVAIFQYGSDVRVPDSRNSFDAYRTVIKAPEGPLAVEMTARSVPPVNPAVMPTTGHWRNSDRSGTGLMISRNMLDQYLLIWITYEEDGTPVWFLSDAVPLDTGVINGTLWKASREAGSVSTESVGTFELSFADTDEALFSWEIDGNLELGSVGAERVTLLHGGSSQTGVWYNSANDWSMGISVSGSAGAATTIVSSLFYVDGEPRWAQGSYGGSVNVMQELDNYYYSSTGLCPNCIGAPISVSSDVAGTSGIRLGSGAQGWIDLELIGGGAWAVGSPSSPVPLSRLTLARDLTR